MGNCHRTAFYYLVLEKRNDASRAIQDISEPDCNEFCPVLASSFPGR